MCGDSWRQGSVSANKNVGGIQGKHACDCVIAIILPCAFHASMKCFGICFCGTAGSERLLFCVVDSNLQSGHCPVMIATDVAARGLDVKDVKAVVNFDFPSNVEDYVHRIGRTGRAGAKGTAYTFFTRKDGNKASALIKVMEQAGQTVPPALMGMSRNGPQAYGSNMQVMSFSLSAMCMHVFDLFERHSHSANVFPMFWCVVYMHACVCTCTHMRIACLFVFMCACMCTSLLHSNLGLSLASSL
jgi:hypothetical protein